MGVFDVFFLLLNNIEGKKLFLLIINININFFYNIFTFILFYLSCDYFQTQF